jgi:hypothetical protein
LLGEALDVIRQVLSGPVLDLNTDVILQLITVQNLCALTN